MTGASLALALTALVPAISGPLPIEQGRAMILELAMCNGGTVRIPVERDLPAVPATTPCCAKGCRSRKRATPFDPEQGREE